MLVSVKINISQNRSKKHLLIVKVISDKVKIKGAKTIVIRQYLLKKIDEAFEMLSAVVETCREHLLKNSFSRLL